MATSPIRHPSSQARASSAAPSLAVGLVLIGPSPSQLLFPAFDVGLERLHLADTVATFIDARTFITAAAQTMRLRIDRLAYVRLRFLSGRCRHEKPGSISLIVTLAIFSNSISLIVTLARFFLV